MSRNRHANRPRGSSRIVAWLTLAALMVQPLAAGLRSPCRKASADGQPTIAAQPTDQAQVRPDGHGPSPAPSCHSTQAQRVDGSPSDVPTNQAGHRTVDRATHGASDEDDDGCACCDDACCCTAAPSATARSVAHFAPVALLSDLATPSTPAADSRWRLDALARGPPTD